MDAKIYCCQEAAWIPSLNRSNTNSQTHAYTQTTKDGSYSVDGMHQLVLFAIIYLSEVISWDQHCYGGVPMRVDKGLGCYICFVGRDQMA